MADIYKLALAAYKRWCYRNNYIYQQPSPDLCVIDGDQFGGSVYLKNCNGYIAACNYHRGFNSNCSWNIFQPSTVTEGK